MTFLCIGHLYAGDSRLCYTRGQRHFYHSNPICLKRKQTSNFRRFTPVFFLHVCHKRFSPAAALILKRLHMEKHRIHQVAAELAIADTGITQKVKAGLLRLQVT